MAATVRRSAGRSPVSKATAGGSRERGGGPDARPAAAGRRAGSIALAAVVLVGSVLLIAWAAAPMQPASSGSTAAALVSRFKGQRPQQQQQQQQQQDEAHHAAHLDAYCEAPLQGLEGPAHLPLTAAATASSSSSSSPPRLLQLQVVIRHGDRSPINALVSPPPRFSCRLRDPGMVRLARLMKAEESDGGPFRIVGLGGTAKRSFLTKALLAEEDGDGGRDGETTKKDPHACFPGQLTERGFRQQVANGRFLRERYGQALGLPLQDPARDIYVRTTHYPRTFQSGAALLLSFLGQAEAAEEAQERAAATVENITVFVQEENGKEPLFGMGLVGAARPRAVDPFEAPANERGPCPLAFHLGARQESAFEHNPEVDQQFYSELGLSAEGEGAGEGTEEGPMGMSVADQADPVMAMHCHDMRPLPVRLATAARLKAEADRLFCQRFTGGDGGREGTRLGMQPFLTEVLDRFQQAADGEPGAVKLALYSAHDTVIAPLVAALDGYLEADGCRGRWPPYASRVVMELWETGEEKEEEHPQQQQRHAVRLLYNGAVISDRARHCPRFKAATTSPQWEDASLLPLECFAQYVDSLDDEAGESCLDSVA